MTEEQNLVEESVELRSELADAVKEICLVQGITFEQFMNEAIQARLQFWKRYRPEIFKGHSNDKSFFTGL